MGRWVRAFEYRRPLFSVFDEAWKFINRGLVYLNAEIVCELLVGLCLLPLARTNIRAEFGSTVTCSDASEKGGGMCASVGVTPQAMEAISAARAKGVWYMNIHGKAEARQQDLVGISGIVHEHLPADASNVRKSGVLVIGVHDGLGSAKSSCTLIA